MANPFRRGDFVYYRDDPAGCAWEVLDVLDDMCFIGDVGEETSHVVKEWADADELEPCDPDDDEGLDEGEDFDDDFDENEPDAEIDEIEEYYSRICTMCGKEGAAERADGNLYCTTCWSIWNS